MLKDITILINLFCIISLTCAYILTFEKNPNPKHKATIGTLNGILFLLYIIFFLFLSIMSIFKFEFIKASILFVFAVNPFIIGKFATFENYKKYSIVQIIMLVLSFCYLT